ncbi:MAG TPA: beta-lactamase family protein [Clostridiales bacterium]|nr:beta-lactamase family protein [Clostridiales bacterium]
MKKGYPKRIIAIVLALLYVNILSPVVYAQTSAVTSYSDAITTSAGADTAASSSVGYEETKKLAEKKASALKILYGTTSVQYALIDGGEIVLSGQAGVYSKNNLTALTKDHMYGIGSISKIFTTVAVMQLVDQGKVKLDNPVIDYIPEFTMADERYKDITVRMLLNHSSGLLGSSFNNSMLFNDEDQSGYNNLLNTLKTSRLKAAPGDFSVYCNDGFSLAQLLVERVSGMDFTSYISESIVAPLKLDHTKTPYEDFSAASLVKTYLPTFKNALPIESLSVVGAGGIYSSAEDLCQFSQIFMKDGAPAVLSPASAKAMENPEYLNGLMKFKEASSLSYGLGWDSVTTSPFTQYNIKALVKGGDTMLYHSSLIVLPEEGMAMAVFTSGGASTYNQVMAQEVLLSALKEKGSIAEIKANPTPTKPEKADLTKEQKKYEGSYVSSVAAIKVTLSKDGILTLSDLSGSGQSAKYSYTGDGKYYSANGSEYLSFSEEANGKTYLYASAYSNLPSLGSVGSFGYQFQKAEPNDLTKQVAAAWKTRADKKYYIINEKYTSQIYAGGGMSLQIKLPKDLEGYCNNAQIIDENTARPNIQIPGVYGRDLNDYSFYKKGVSEYLTYGSYLLKSEDNIRSLFTWSGVSFQIGKEGYAKWYKIGDKSKNRKLKVTAPENSSFTVFDSNGVCLFNSWVSKENTVTLPENGMIVFAGDPYVTFVIQYIK